MTLADLATQRCRSQSGSEHRLEPVRIQELLIQLPEWKLDVSVAAISKDFHFEDFHHTLGFINAVGFMANQADHHPDIEAGYGHCLLRWSTHDCDGLSMNDFICAARVEKLFTQTIF